MQIKRTHTFTVFSFHDMKYDRHYSQLELIQENLSIIINIEFFSGYNLIFPENDELLSNMSSLMKINTDMESIELILL